jgi:hypothetical protein
MVIVPLLVMYVNWACTIAGNANSKNNGSSLAKQASLRRWQKRITVWDVNVGGKRIRDFIK